MDTDTYGQRLPGGSNKIRPQRPQAGRGNARQALPWYVLVLPAVALTVWLVASPFVQSVLLGFQTVSIGAGATWVGFANFTRMANDPAFWSALGNTLYFATATTLLELVLGWILAALLWGAFRKTGSIIRVLFAIPMLLSPVVAGVVWSVLLNPQYGWVPAFFHDQSLALLSSPKTALPTMVVVDAWQWTPFMFLILSAGLNALPEDVLEAARVDGASAVRMFRSIVWPLTMPVTMVAVLFRSLDSLKAFDLPYNLTHGGPGTSTQTLAIYLYQEAFTRYDQGYAAAIALVATVLMAVVAIALLVVLRRAEGRIS